MTVAFYGRITEYTNGESTFTPAPGVCTTLRELLDMLGNCYGESFKSFLSGDETCLILINSSGIAFSGGLDTPLKQKDKIEILPFVDAG